MSKNGSASKKPAKVADMSPKKSPKGGLPAVQRAGR
jgi:hypothetical protein